ncbi:hypothetical protein SPOG_05488 [Schizosaccharomyces cryophilus OY26]|uniref:Uncharacterized protein n=1 Tax=Schizosaccharomyces cryophilus (strain OY26 / ATCC MYA-4695 / CBS 11777 / NBRC 106824 / NRRL Y48691) TaxID=653667 RepID=S9VZH4_SCHCR|nr:uncharacterized protein SPOG_05488 [Schizosaccharomyces cryophilus OY26]EPY53043.1 hypothetical protein SPOG_05488 [Schizosaccharomyces cryophilus OY26]
MLFNCFIRFLFTIYFCVLSFTYLFPCMLHLNDRTLWKEPETENRQRKRMSEHLYYPGGSDHLNCPCPTEASAFIY